MATPVYIPTNPFPHILANICYFLLNGNGQSNHLTSMRWYLLVVLLCISPLIRDVENHVGHLYIFFGKMFIQFLCSYFNQTIWTLSCTIALYLLDINPLIRCIIWKLLPFSRLPFNLLMVSFIIQKIFSLMKSYLFLLLLSLPMESDAKIISKSSVKELTTYVFS